MEECCWNTCGYRFVDLILSRLLSRGVVGETPSRPDIIWREKEGLSMMRLKSPTIAGFLLDANPTNVIPLDLAKASAAELIAPTAMINSTPERTPLATNSQPILLDITTILESK